MSTFSGKKFTRLNNRTKNTEVRGFFKNPFFYFGIIPLVLLGLLFFNSGNLAEVSYLKSHSVVFAKNIDNSESDNLFFSQNKALAFETPDLKIIQDNFIYGISTPRVLTTQTLGSVFGDLERETQKEISDYKVELGDTAESVAQKFNISLNTLLWANPGISKGSGLKADQNLLIPPGNGVIYVVKPGDTISNIAQKYKSSAEKIIAFNELRNERDISVDDLLFLPDAQMLKQQAPIIAQIPVPNTFFINPTEGRVSQWRHGFAGRAIDVANKCGTPVNAAASGVVQRAQFHSSYGNFVTISHSNGTSTYYGHLQSIMVKPGEQVSMGQMIGLIGRSGRASTGCHLHFEVRGTGNFLAAFGLGANVSYKQ